MIKILTICSNAFNSSNSNGRTLMNLLYNAKPDNLAEFYVSNDYPNFEKCGYYYKITDNDLIKFFLGKKVGREVICKNNKFTKTDLSSPKTIKLKLKQSFFCKYLRNIFWGFNFWQNKELWNWIEKFKPEVILLFSGNNAFLDKIAWQVSDKYSIPIVLFNCEDYYFQAYHNKYNIFERLNRRFCDNTFRKSIKKISGVVYNSHKIKETYDKEFPNTKSIVCYQPGTKFNICKEKNGKIVYLGNITNFRVKSLVEISNILQERNLKLDVYGNINNESVKFIITNNKNINYHGLVSYDECKKIMEESSIVIHCDDIENIFELRHAMSGKTGDCLSCGTPIFAYGPKESAVMDYYIKNNCAMTCTSKEELKDRLFEALDNKELMNNYLNNALNLAKENHNIEKTSTEFFEFVNEIVENYKNNESITN